MTRVLIPRSDNTSAKIVEASDFEKYHSFLNDHIISGFVVSAGSGLDVDVGTGTGRLQGLYVENTVTCNVSGLTACSTNYLYISIDRDPNCEPEGWSFVTNTTNTTHIQAPIEHNTNMISEHSLNMTYILSLMPK